MLESTKPPPEPPLPHRLLVLMVGDGRYRPRGAEATAVLADAVLAAQTLPGSGEDSDGWSDAGDGFDGFDGSDGGSNSE